MAILDTAAATVAPFLRAAATTVAPFAKEVLKAVSATASASASPSASVAPSPAPQEDDMSMGGVLGLSIAGVAVFALAVTGVYFVRKSQAHLSDAEREQEQANYEKFLPLSLVG